MMCVQEGGLYKFIGCPLQELVHYSISLCELWHRIFSCLHYRDLPSLRKMIIGLPELQIEHDGICRGCVVGNNFMAYFPSSDNQSKGILDLVHSNVCGLMTIPSFSDFL